MTCGRVFQSQEAGHVSPRVDSQVFWALKVMSRDLKSTQMRTGSQWSHSKDWGDVLQGRGSGDDASDQDLKPIGVYGGIVFLVGHNLQ